MRRLLCVALLLGAMMGVLAYGAGTATAWGPITKTTTTTTHFTASYPDWTGAHYVCSGFRFVRTGGSSGGGPPGASPPATVMDEETCQVDTSSAWYVFSAGTYPISPQSWISDYDGLIATAGTVTVIQRVPGIQLWLIEAWY